MKLLLPLLLPAGIAAKAILGVDLGSLYMKVALVQRGSPLEIVTNLHSKRKTEQMVLFDSGARFYGADANSLITRKPHLTPQAMSVLLGRHTDHPIVQVLTERHYPISPVYNETRSGVCLHIDGRTFTPEELVAMVLTHAKDITNAFGVPGEVKDCVLTVPSFYTQHERRALLDAAALADLNVLALIDENTAAGLHYGIDRVEEEPRNILFYNMGASALQVSIMQFYSYERKESKYGKGKKVGAFQVLGKGWDASVGGEAFDARIVNFMADEFNEIWNKKRNDGKKEDVRKYPRAMAKLRVQANKVKQVLSANTDVPIFIDSLHDDVNYASHLTRATFEEFCHDLLERSIVPITNALKAANMTLADIHGVELIGGGMRVPKVQANIQEALGDSLELGMHINSDESMALGAAFHGANVSTAFKVRHVGMTDINPFPVSVALGNLESEEKSGLFGKGKKKNGEEEEWSKEATIFKANGKIGIKKTIAFTHDQDVDCTVKYEPDEFLPEGTNEIIEKYNITGVEKFAKEMEAKGLGKPKVSLQFELSSSGIITLSKAEAAVEETYTITEEVEVDDEESSTDESKEGEKSDAKSEEKKDADVPDEKTDGTEEKKEEPQKKKTISVEKEKKRVHKGTLTVNSYHVGSVQPYNEVIMAESKAKLDELARMDKERMMFEEVRNNYEAYIYSIKNKLVDMEDEIKAVTSEEQRASVANAAEAAENWMYDEGYDADFETYKAKYEQLKAPFEKILYRVKEVTARADAIADLSKKLEKLEALMVKWETTMPQVTEEERAEVTAGIAKVREWITEKVAAQEAADPTTDPVFTSDEVPLQTVSLQATVSRLSKKPKPAPKKEEKKPEGEAGEDSKSETNEEGEKGQDGSEPESESSSTQADESQSDASEEL